MENVRGKTEFPFLNGISPDFIRFPPNSKPPVGFNHVQKIKDDFSSTGASMLQEKIQ